MSTRTTPRSSGTRARRLIRPEDGRRNNIALVLQTLYDHSGLSRADLARQTGLTRVTVSDLVAELLDDGLIREAGPNEQVRPGKPGTALALVPDARDLLAIDLSDQVTLHGAILSLQGEVVHRVDRPLAGARGDAALATVTELARDLQRAATHPAAGLGVGSPGLVDADGVVLNATSLGWRDVNLAAHLEAALGLPADVANDANLAAQAEHRFAGGSANLLRLQIVGGLGAALLVGGTPVLGENSAAGEIGHVVVEPDGAPCRCGKRGCLETWLATPHLTQRLADDPGHHDEILAAAGRHLGTVLAPVVAVLDLSQVILGGPRDLLDGPLLAAAQATLTEDTRVDFRGPAQLTHSTLGDDAVILGAAALVLRRRLGVR
ncbi:MAG: ROK family transcriptional regulator [Propionibacteriaceae bacterium]|jgi:predicted NBD/HSP70 family sugar kinase|nr:ROK family transcriptional regulator [Propionibacteriaceae bacterium]